MRQNNSVINKILLGLLIGTLVACGSGDVDVTAEFRNTNDIKEGTAVYFNEMLAGEVTEVDVDGNRSRVGIRFNQAIAEKISGSAAVVVNRLKEGAPLEVYNRSDAKTDPVQSGQTVQGLDSMLQLGAWMVGDVIQLGADAVSTYVEAFQGYLKSDKFQQDKTEMQDQIDHAGQAAREAIKSVERELDNAVIEINGQERSASEAIEQLGEELAPLVQDLGKNGAEIIAELEKFTEGLKTRTDAEQKKAGEEFLNSLLITLEKLNSSMEEGMRMNRTNEEHDESEPDDQDYDMVK